MKTTTTTTTMNCISIILKKKEDSLNNEHRRCDPQRYYTLASYHKSFLRPSRHQYSCAMKMVDVSIVFVTEAKHASDTY